MLKSQLKFIITIALVLGLSISFQSLLAQWQAPTAGPPGNNIDKPINTGLGLQEKLGDLKIGGDFGVGKNFKVLGDLYASTTIKGLGNGLNIDAGDFGMEFNINSDGIGTDDFIFYNNGTQIMKVDPAGNIYSNSSIIPTLNEVNSNFYDKTEIDAGYYTKSETYSQTEIDNQTYTQTEVQELIASLVVAADSSLDLYLGLHSSAQCAAAGGGVETIGVNDFCKFSGRSSCEPGWIPYPNLNSTTAKTCTYDKCVTNNRECSASFWCSPSNMTETSSCTTSSHSYAIQSTETCTVINAIISSWSAPNRGGGDKTIYQCVDSNVTCYASITSVGCY